MLLAFSLVLGLFAFPALAAAAEDQQGIFTPCEVKTALEALDYTAPPNTSVTILEVASWLTRAMGWTLDDISLDFEVDTVCLGATFNRREHVYRIVTTPQSRLQSRTLREFIELQAVFAYRSDEAPQLLYVVDNAITSPILGTGFLSDAEAAALTADLDQPLAAGTAAVLLARMDYYYHLLPDGGPLSEDQAAEIFTALLPEYAPMLQMDDSALSYWLQGENRIWTALRMAVHEMTHEFSTRQGGAYHSRKKFDSGKWFGMVYWNEAKNRTFFTGTSTITTSELSLPPLSVIYPLVPEKWREDSTYSDYFPDVSKTLADALQEYTATAAELTTSLRLQAMGKSAATLRDRYIDWSYYIQLYFLYLQEHHPDKWRAVLNDGTISRVFCEMDVFMQRQFSLEHAQFSTTSHRGDETLELLSSPEYVALRGQLAEAAKEAAK